LQAVALPFLIDVTSVAVANSLEKIAIPQNRAILHVGWLFFLLRF
jgi:hypothetical protein